MINNLIIIYNTYINDENKFVLKCDQVRPEDYYIRFIPHVPE